MKPFSSGCFLRPLALLFIFIYIFIPPAYVEKKAKNNFRDFIPVVLSSRTRSQSGGWLTQERPGSRVKGAWPIVEEGGEGQD